MPFVLLETRRFGPDESRTICIEQPEVILQTNRISDVPAILQELQKSVDRGFLAAGFISYEAGSAFVPHLRPVNPSSFPLIWFALTRSPGSFVPDHFLIDPEPQVSDLHLDTSPEEYAEKIEKVKRYIEEGQTYQVNFTMRYRGKLFGTPRGLYRRLRSKQRVSYAAYIESDDWAVLSLSPELFFRKRGNQIFTRPMKGTSPRGKTLQEDRQLAEQLISSEKERAENLMIVDLLRNDLGKICLPGTVVVTHPLETERYETLLQMTSSIEGILPKDTGVAEIFQATFPCGSITGAPKLRTMQIIQELEKSARRIYTGAIGYVSQAESVFSVAIRTAIVEGDRIEMGVGSGILHEADADREYHECVLKAKFLTESRPQFQLIETILWDDGEFKLLDFHLDRLIDSANYFLIPLDRESVLQSLRQHAPQSNGSFRVRLLASIEAKIEISTTRLDQIPSNRVRWATRTINSQNVFLYHKTTLRPLYEEELRRAREEGYGEVFFCNERGEVTEGAFSNIWILRDGVHYTPPVSCGLLAGTYRRYLLERNGIRAEERVLFKQDVENAEAVLISNALRGLMRVSF